MRPLKEPYKAFRAPYNALNRADIAGAPKSQAHPKAGAPKSRRTQKQAHPKASAPKNMRTQVGALEALQEPYKAFKAPYKALKRAL